MSIYEEFKALIPVESANARITHLCNNVFNNEVIYNTDTGSQKCCILLQLHQIYSGLSMVLFM